MSTTATTARQELEAADAEFRQHCRESYPAPGQVYAEDAATIERVAQIIRRAAEAIHAECGDSHTFRLNATAGDLAELIAEAIDAPQRSDAPSEASALLGARLRYAAAQAPFLEKAA